MEGAVPTDTKGSFVRSALMRVVSVTVPEPTAMRNSVSRVMDSSTSPQERSSGSISPSRWMTQFTTVKPASSSAFSTSAPATR